MKSLAELSSNFHFTLKTDSRHLSCVSILFLAVVTVETICIVYLYLQQMRQGLLFDSFTHFNGLALVPTALFQMYFAFDAVYSESGVQLFMFLLVSFLMGFRSLDIYYEALSIEEHRFPRSLAMVCNGVFVATLLHIPLCYHVHKSFGYLIYYSVSANFSEVIRYKNYQRYVGMMKLDLQFCVTGAITLAFYFSYNTLEHALSCVLVAATVVLSIVSVFMVQRESSTFCRMFFAFSCILPVYGLRKIHLLWWDPSRLNWAQRTQLTATRTESLRVFMTVTGVLEILARCMMLYYLQAVMADFGEGLLIKVFEKNRLRASMQHSECTAICSP
eukprot:GGOE01041175.1.p1 GENE.GGOE01041175.1~~GGOE01041175.1.p1  ORF type:complete len:331 (+),score=99.56 GGOE01041175.1:108-1100(+)